MIKPLMSSLKFPLAVAHLIDLNYKSFYLSMNCKCCFHVQNLRFLKYWVLAQATLDRMYLQRCKFGWKSFECCFESCLEPLKEFLVSCTINHIKSLTESHISRISQAIRCFCTIFIRSSSYTIIVWWKTCMIAVQTI